MTFLSILPLLLAPVCLAAILALRWHRLEHAPGRPEVFSAEMGMLMVLVMFVLGRLGMIAATAIFSIDAATLTDLPVSEQLPQNTKLMFGVYAGYSLAAVVLVLSFRAAERPAPEARPGPARAAGLGVGGLVLWWPIVTTVGVAAAAVMEHVFHRPVDPIAHDTLALLLESPRNVWFYTLTALVVIAAPIVEELMYRGLMQNALIRFGLGRWPAIILTSTFFAAMHWSNTAPHAVATLFVLSLGFGLVYERTGRIAAPIAMHVLFNLGNVVLASFS